MTQGDVRERNVDSEVPASQGHGRRQGLEAIGHGLLLFHLPVGGGIVSSSTGFGIHSNRPVISDQKICIGRPNRVHYITIHHGNPGHAVNRPLILIFDLSGPESKIIPHP